MLTGLNAGQVYDLDRDETVIGRSRDAHVRVEDTGVSRRNARVMRSPAGYFVEDLGSRNGTYKNGARIVARTKLASGDRVQLGPSVALRFSIVDDTEEELARRLYEASTRDALTQIYNRRYFNQRLVAELAFAQRHRTPVSVVLFDIDYFKRVNDTWGHKAGDDVLRSIAAGVQAVIRAEDLFARYGGEEFAILARGIDPTGTRAFAERVRAAVAALEIAVGDAHVRVSVSAGVACLTECTGGGGDDLLLLADDRLYRAKSHGRNRVCAE